MAIRFPRIMQAKQVFQAASRSLNIPKGYCTVHVGENKKKRFVIPVSFLNQPQFQELLSKAEEEFGFSHPTGGLTIPCREDTFVRITNRLQKQ